MLSLSQHDGPRAGFPPASRAAARYQRPGGLHAITGGTGRYTGADGEFSFTIPSPGVLDMTLTLQH